MPLEAGALGGQVMPGRDAARIIAQTSLTVFIDAKLAPIQVTKWQAKSYCEDLGQKFVALIPVTGGGMLITKPTRVRNK